MSSWDEHPLRALGWTERVVPSCRGVLPVGAVAEPGWAPRGAAEHPRDALCPLLCFADPGDQSLRGHPLGGRRPGRWEGDVHGALLGVLLPAAGWPGAAGPVVTSHSHSLVCWPRWPWHGLGSSRGRAVPAPGCVGPPRIQECWMGGAGAPLGPCSLPHLLEGSWWEQEPLRMRIWGETARSASARGKFSWARGADGAGTGSACCWVLVSSSFGAVT